MIRITIRTRESGVFIETNKWLCEKTRFPLKLTDRRFQSAARPQKETAELVPREIGENGLFHSVATNRRSNAELDLTQTGVQRRFHLAGTTTVSFGGFKTIELT